MRLWDHLPDLDESVYLFKKWLQERFPDMPRKLVDANWDFMYLLEDCDAENMNWIPPFLKKNWFKTEWIKFIPEWSYPQYSDEQVENLINWKWRVWPKSFYEFDKEGVPTIDDYMVLASKKNNPLIEGFKNAFNDITSWSLSTQK